MEAQGAVSNENIELPVPNLREELGALRSYQPAWSRQIPVLSANSVPALC